MSHDLGSDARSGVGSQVYTARCAYVNNELIVIVSDETVTNRVAADKKLIIIFGFTFTNTHSLCDQTFIVFQILWNL